MKLRTGLVTAALLGAAVLQFGASSATPQGVKAIPTSCPACAPGSKASLIGGSARVDAPVTGDYVEARTASVFAGACHYNGELVTTGREAVLAWRIASGSHNGVDLTGVKAMATVVGQANLGDNAAARKSELIVDASATDAQVAAMTDLLNVRTGSRLGTIVSVKREQVHFDHTGPGFTVEADGFASLTVNPMPNGECCTQPHLVWYEPLVPIEGRKVGYTSTAQYTAGTLGDCWQRGDENSAFYGALAF